MMRSKLLPVCVWLTACWAGGCRQQPTDELVQAAPVAIPQPPPIGDQPGPYVIRYFSPTSGQLVAAKTPSEVPAGARSQVIVSYEDPALQGSWVFVADLTQSQGGTYPVRGVSRAELEAQHAPPPSAAAEPVAQAPAAPADRAPAEQPLVRPAPPAAPQQLAKSADKEVIIYRTSWCGYCKKTAEYLTLKHVPFVEKDLERDAGARQDMLARAQRAGVPQQRLQGVPILWVRGTMITGFDRNAIDRALGG